MEPDELTADEILAATALIRAVWTQDEQAVATLMDRGRDERPMALLVALLGRRIIYTLLAGTYGLDDAMDEDTRHAVEETMSQDLSPRLSHLLAETVLGIAPTADTVQCRVMARSIVGYLLAVTQANEANVPEMLAMLRDGALQPGT